MTKEIILNVTVIIVVCFLLGLILEGTKFESSANRVFGLILIANLIISILTSFSNFSFENPNFNIEIDQNYIENINSYKLNILKDNLLQKFKDLGINNCGIYFSTISNDNSIEISKVHIDLTICEYDKNSLNIDELKNIVEDMLKLDKENIIVYA